MPAFRALSMIRVEGVCVESGDGALSNGPQELRGVAQSTEPKFLKLKYKENPRVTT